MPRLLAALLALALTAPAASGSPAPSPSRSPGATAEPVAADAPPPADPAGTDAWQTDGEVRPTLADRVAFAAAEVVTRVERLDHELGRLAEEARYAAVEISEPYYDGVGEDSVRIAAAVTGRPVGATLDEADAADLVARAQDEMAPTLALAGVDEQELTRDGLAAAAAGLGIDIGDAPFEPAVLSQLRALSDERLVPAVVALGRDPGRRVSRADLAPILTQLGADPAHLTGDALARVVAEAQFRLAPVAYATGIDHDHLVTRAGLADALTRLGVPFGDEVDASDVATAVRATTGRLTLTPPRSLGGSLTFQRLYAPSPSGPEAGFLLRWRTGPDGGIDVDTDFAGSFNARASMPSAAARRRDAAAVVNGGYWALGGDPDGLLVSDGRLVSSRETLRDWVRGTRAGFGLTADGRSVVGTPEFAFGVDLPSGPVEVDGVDRPVGDDEAVLYTHTGFIRPLPDDAVTVVTPGPGSLVRPSSSPFEVATGGPRDAVPARQLLLVARGAKAAALRAADGRQATLRVEVGDAWQGIDAGMSGGPWLLRDGRVPDVEEWRTEGFGAAHTDGLHPRTAIGFDGGGNGFILTVDGRQPGYSAGMSHRGMGELMAALGVRDAVMLDGGSSSQMVVGGRLVNRPCCDRGVRPLATAVYLTPA